MKLMHPDSKIVVETDSPEAYRPSGWVEKAAAPKSDK